MKKLTLYLCRHGETDWSRSGRHTGHTDLPLTKEGEEESERLKQRLEGIPFDKVYVSPSLRARTTAAICGFANGEILSDLTEWNYGDYEGLTTPEIWETVPGWTIFNDGAPGGESVEEIGARADRVLALCSQWEGNVALFSSAHFSRVLAARWLGFSPGDGRSFVLSTASLSILGHEREVPVLRLWNEVSI